mmetsp:Transcript_132070/g.313023  ORF Transcript_132070/g.313023 Transcript_132070/m.313023 type:complete len:294 (+) Transcript_132070:43-924(+)
MSLLRVAVVFATVACGTQSKGSIDSECQDEHCAVSHLQLQTALVVPPAVESFFALAPGELQHCQEPPPEEDYAKPITEVLYEHPGEDAWCILSKATATGGFNFSLACAMARKHQYIRGYAEYDYQRVQFETKTAPQGVGEAFHLKSQKEVVLPSGSSLMVRDYTDIFCAINGYYNVSRAAVLNDYEYLTHVSGNLCSIAKQRVPDYTSLSLNDMILRVVPHMNYINKLLMSDNPVVHLNQTDVDIMYTTAGVQCRMDNDHGGNCDVAYCAYRGCLDADGMTVKQTDKGECPRV